MVLQTIISQQLLPTIDGGLAPAFEIMHLNSAIRNLIRDSKTHQIDTVIQSSSSEGMVGMDSSIFALYTKKLITSEVALNFAYNTDWMERKLSSR
jgi:twitching motility protein PilT